MDNVRILHGWTKDERKELEEARDNGFLSVIALICSIKRDDNNCHALYEKYYREDTNGNNQMARDIADYYAGVAKFPDKKYKLKLDYTADELKELKELSKTYKSPMNVIRQIVESYDNPLRNLREKYLAMEYEDEFDFMADINSVVMGTAIFPEQKYVVHDKVIDRYIYFNKLEKSFYWSQLQARMPEIKTKEAWLNINPSYELRLERVD